MVFIPEKIKLLFIEDEEASATATTRLLKADKNITFNIVHRPDLKTGLEYLKKECVDAESCSIDVILLDLMLPNSQGVDTYIKVHESCDHIPVVIISGFEDIACECVKEGAQDFLIKPVETGSLIRSLKYAIERKKLQDQRRASEERFQLLTEANFEGIAITKDFIFLDVNQQFADMVQYPIDELIGKRIFDFVAEKDLALVKENISAESEVPYDHMAIKKDGSKFPVEIRGKTVPNGLRLTAIRDMTVYREAEKEIKLSEKKYKDLVEATNAGIYEIDFVNDRFTYVNRMMCEQTGYTEEELLSMGPSSMLTKKSIEDWIIRWEALNNGEYIEKTFEYEARKKDGAIIWVLVTAEYKENEEGLVVGARVVAIDITEKKLAKEEAQKKEEVIFNQLEDKLHEWRDELKESSIIQQNKIRDVGMNIQSITNRVEVS